MPKYSDIRKSLKQKFNERKKIFGGWISFDNPSITEIFASIDYDFIAIDMEHSTISLEQCQRIIAASQSFGIPCLPRPVSQSNDWFKPILDSGADGLFVTTVNDASETKKIIEKIKYPPVGNRSYGINRAQLYGFESLDYFKTWNDESIIVLQIENIIGVGNIKSILDCGNIDAIMIGPYDLSGSLGVPGQMSHSKVIEATQKVIEVCNEYKVSCGTQIAEVNQSSVDNLFNQGYTYAILGSDLFLLWRAAQKMQDLIKANK